MDPLVPGLAALLVVLVLVALLRRGGDPRRDADPQDAPHRLAQLCSRLSGDPHADAPLANQILALGPGVVPLLIEHLINLLRRPEGPEGPVQARLEEIIADFGLAAVPAVADRLARLKPTARPAPALLRILERMGGPGARAFLPLALDRPALLVYIPRFRLETPHHRDPAGTFLAVLRRRPLRRLGADLNWLAAWHGRHQGLLEVLQSEASAEAWTALLEWLADWPRLATPAQVARALMARQQGVWLAAGSLARVAPHDALTLPLVEGLSSPWPACRRLAARALADHPGAVTEAALREALRDPDPEVALEALMTLQALTGEAPEALRAAAPALEVDPRADLISPPSRTLQPTESTPPPVEALSHADSALRQTAIRALTPLISVDPRARERLLRVAEGPDPLDRAQAVLALSSAGESAAREVLAAAAEAAILPEARRLLQTARRHQTAEAGRALARALSGWHSGVEAGLAVLRAGRFEDAVPALLRALEASKDPRQEALIATTLDLGGPEVRAALIASLEQPGRGLLTAALRYLSAFATPDDLPRLMTLYERHPPLRAAILNLIESQGEAGARCLKRRVAQGGEDAILEPIEARLATLEAVLAAGRAHC